MKQKQFINHPLSIRARDGGDIAQEIVADLMLDNAELENDLIVWEYECNRIISETGAEFRKSNDLLK